MNYFTARNIVIYSELDNILSAFSASDIKVIVLAGAALGVTVYPNIAERPMGDIDLLIRHRDKQAIGDLLENLGYVLDTARSDEAHYSKTLDTFTLHIDCHTDLRHYLDDRALAGVWNRARRVLSHRDTECTEMLILSPEDTLIYTAVDSAIYHGRITANTINDIKNIIKHYDNSSCSKSPHPPFAKGEQGGLENKDGFDVRNINWPLVIQLIKSYRLETPLYILFDLCRQEGVPIPDEVIGAPRPVRDRSSHRDDRRLTSVNLPVANTEGISKLSCRNNRISNGVNPRKRSLEYRLYRTILNSAFSAPKGRDLASGGRMPHSVLHEDATRVLCFLLRPVARWELFMNSFFPSLRFVKQQYAGKLHPAQPQRSSLARSLRCSDYFGISAILYPLRLCTLIWRMNKAMYQLTLRML